MPDLERCYIASGVTTLFTNIGWQYLLRLDYPGYLRPTLEFASSVEVTGMTLHFRLFNQPFHLTFSQLCSLIGAPSTETGAEVFDPNHNLDLFRLQNNQFWRDITGGDTYVAKRAKASMIVHPVMRVAHRILACSVHAREEPTTVSRAELQILYAMVHPEHPKPCFGAVVCKRLQGYSTRNSGAIACGGIVTLISTHPDIPDIPTDLPTIPGSHLIGLDQLKQMQMVEEPIQGTFVWMVGREKRPFLRINRATRNRLALRRPVARMDLSLGYLVHAPPPPLADEPPAAMNVDAPDPPDGVHPWVYQHINQIEHDFSEFRLEQQHYGGLVEQIFQWTQDNPRHSTAAPDPDSD